MKRRDLNQGQSSRRTIKLGKRRAIDRDQPRLTQRPKPHPAISPDEYCQRSLTSLNNGKNTKRPLALVIAAYNEALVIEHTIKSAIEAGLPAHDIFVVDDSSSDQTAMIARRVVGKQNVLTVERSGKGLALHTIVKRLKLTRRYDWIHIADADGEFDKDYFAQLHSNLDPNCVAGTGYVASLDGSYVSKYRTFEYTLGMDITRRVQAMGNVISIIPGPTSIFRSDIFDKLDFNAKALCEDFDVTLQIHRNNLGKIQFIPSAIARTQDPATLSDFIRQITRWNRGILQMFFKHKIGRKLSKIDAYLWYQVSQNLMFASLFLIFLPIMTIISSSWLFISVAFISDVITVWLLAVYVAMRRKQPSVLASFPITYAMRWLQLFVFLKAFFELFVLKKFRLTDGTWETVQRRTQSA